jgi:hypothetical protein
MRKLFVFVLLIFLITSCFFGGDIALSAIRSVKHPDCGNPLGAVVGLEHAISVKTYRAMND